MKNLISQICGNYRVSLNAHHTQQNTDPKTLQWASQLATRPAALTAQ